MSVVTNYMLLPSTLDQHNLKMLNELLPDKMWFVDTGHECGGNKYLEAEVWLSAVNYGPLPKDVIEAIKKLDWFEPEVLIFAYMLQEDDGWTFIKEEWT